MCVAPGHGWLLKLALQVFQSCQSVSSMGYKIQGGFAEFIAVPEHIYRLGLSIWFPITFI